MRTDGAVVDFDLHGLAVVRLVDARPGDVRGVARQLGPIQSPEPTGRPADVVVRFVDRLPLAGRLRLLGVDDAGFTDDAFVVLRGKHKSAVRVRIPFDRLAGGEITCERGLAAVPLLIPILNHVLVQKGVLPLHATAFAWRGRTVLATGWAKGGKTELLLAFAAHGAAYVGDEWVYIEPATGRLVGVPEPIRLWDWHLDDLPAVRRRLARSDRVRLAGTRLAESGLARLGAGALGRTPVGGVARRARALVHQQRNVQVPPQRLFGDGTRREAVLDVVVLVGSHAAPETTLTPIDGAEVAARMAHSLAYEALPLVEPVLKYRFAFPGARVEDLADAEARRRALLERALSGRPAFALWHPYPAPIPALFDALAPALEVAA